MRRVIDYTEYCAIATDPSLIRDTADLLQQALDSVNGDDMKSMCIREWLNSYLIPEGDEAMALLAFAGSADSSLVDIRPDADQSFARHEIRKICTPLSWALISLQATEVTLELRRRMEKLLALFGKR